MPIAHGERARASPDERQMRPVRRYQAPAASIGGGKNRHDEKMPRLKTICQSPGIIQMLCGTYRPITAVSKAPATTEGRNCSTAMRIISSARLECTRRLRVYIWAPIKAPDSTAVHAQMARKV